jgi:ParB family transcriptional regulator, chromosome partitioning protein
MSLGKAESLRQRLGIGLADSIGVREGEALIPEATPTAAPPPVNFTRNRAAGEIDPDQVIPDPDQPRKEFDEEQLQNLARDIAARGQLQPIRCRWSAEHEKWIIIAGERRWRACKLAGLPKISCTFIDRDMTEQEIRSEQLVENLLREDLSPMEEARGFRQLMELNGWSATELAAQLHVSNATVSRAVALLKLPVDLQAKVDDGTLPPTTAYQVAKVKDATKQRQLAEKAVTGQMKSVETAKASQASSGTTRSRRTTNETFRTTEGAKIVITCRKDLGDDGVVSALLEAVEAVRKRKAGKKKAG